MPSPVLPTFSYLPHPHHRDGNRNKSQWTIVENDEVKVFNFAIASSWISGTSAWGVYLSDGNNLNYLGISKDRSRTLFLAKFVNKTNQTQWHGYPADHQINCQDIPAMDIQRRWLEANILSPAKIRKIAKGQPCNL